MVTITITITIIIRPPLKETRQKNQMRRRLGGSKSRPGHGRKEKNPEKTMEYIKVPCYPVFACRDGGNP
jgi:hypothetical protein